MLPEQPIDVRAAVRAAQTATGRMPLLTKALTVQTVLLIVWLPGLAFGRRDPRGGGDVVGLLVLGGTVATIVLWTRWFYAVYRAVCALGRGRYLPMWGGLAWFIPYATLFVPKQLVNDLWRPDRKAPGVVRAWWVAWLLLAVPAALAELNPLPARVTFVVAFLGWVAATGLGVWTARAVTDRLELLVRQAAVEPAAW